MELNPLKQINPVVVVSVIVIFTCTYYILRKIFFLPLIEVMEKRHERIEGSKVKLIEAQKIVGRAEKEASATVAGARENADSISRDMRERVEEVRKERIDAAKKEADEFLETGRKEILMSKEAEQAKLRKEAVECVGLACDKLLGKVETNTVETVIDKLMAKRMH